MENRSRSATVYPQSHPPLPNSTNTTTARGRARTCRLIALAIAAIFCVPIASLALYLRFHRPGPPGFRVNSLSLSNLNLNLSSSSSIAAATWAADFTVLNPNRKTTLYLDQLKAAVYYDDDALLSVTAVPPFLVPPAGNGTNIRATFAAVGAYVDEEVVEGINGSRVVFQVKVLARVRLHSGWWWGWQDCLRVYCGDLGVGMNSSMSVGGGNLIGGPRECSISDADAADADPV